VLAAGVLTMVQWRRGLQCKRPPPCLAQHTQLHGCPPVHWRDKRCNLEGWCKKRRRRRRRRRRRSRGVEWDGAAKCYKMRVWDSDSATSGGGASAAEKEPNRGCKKQ
jgi:hypothetical protein